MFYKAELDGIICSGIIKNGKPTFALLDERVPSNNKIKREEALTLLAKKYFISHGPATLQDFSWWSGLNLTNSKLALEVAKNDLVSKIIDDQTYWSSNSFSLPNHEMEVAYLLPTFDEFIISYKDRTATLTSEKNDKTISSNGISQPVIIAGG